MGSLLGFRLGITFVVFQSVGMILLFMILLKSFVMTMMVKYERCFRCIGEMFSRPCAFEGLEFYCSTELSFQLNFWK